VVLVDDAVSGLYDRGADELRRIGVAVVPTPAVVAALAGLYDPVSPRDSSSGR